VADWDAVLQTDGRRVVRGAKHLADGRIGRVLFAIVDGQMVLLHGFVKKSQATPKGDLELARRRQKEVQS
jgi:phage-related protein